MASIADLYFSFRGDDKQLQVDASKAGDKAGQTLGQRLGLSFSKAAFGIGVGAALTTKALDLVGGAVSGVIDYMGEAVHAASDLNETMSKSEVVFDRSADQVSKWGDTSARAFGLSKQAAVEAASSFGNVFKGLGFASDKSAQMSEKLVELAGDLASFNNIDPGDALEKLRSGLAGEAEPLRSVGVFLNEASVKAKAMQLGLGNAHGELTEGEKILARYQLILEQTTTAQGDFARTADGVANSERTLHAIEQDREAQIGQKLIPLEKAWQDVRLDLLDKSGDLVTLLDRENHSARDNEQALRGLLNIFPGLGDAILGNVEALQSAIAGDLELSHWAGKAADDVATLGQKSNSTAPKVATLGDKLADAEQAAKDLDSAISDLTDTIVDELYGDTIRAGREADLKGQIHDLSKELDATTNKRKALELKGQIAELRGELFNLHLEEAARNGPQAAIDFLKKEEAHAGDAKDEIKKLIAKYQELAGLQGDLGPIIVVGGAPHGPARKRAAGGPISAGEAYLVGERGPEVVVPDRPGVVVAFEAVRALMASLMASWGVPVAHGGAQEYSTGTNYVPYNMLAYLHQGEIVIPPDQSERIRSGLASVGSSGAGDAAPPITFIVPAPSNRSAMLEALETARRYRDFGLFDRPAKSTTGA